MAWAAFALMLACFIVFTLLLKWPVGVGMMVGSAAALILTGRIAEWSHLVEGSLSYLDAMLVIATAMIFMRALTATGRFQAVSDAIVGRFGRQPWVLLPLLMLLVMFPGMLTGSSIAAVLTGGALVAPVLVRMGLDKVRVAAIIAMGGVFGMVAPPVNLPVMIIGSGVDMPYTGFTLPLLLLTFPLAWLTVYLLGMPLLRKRVVTAGNVAALGEHEAVGEQAAATEEQSVPQAAVENGIGKPVRLASALVPICFVAIWMVIDYVWAGVLPHLGLPLLFVIGAAITFGMAGYKPWFTESMEAVRQSLPVLSILAGVGMFIQIMTLVGARGTLVVALLSLPKAWQLVAMGLGMPAFGAISAYGSASVMGVPFLLALLDKNEIIVGAALSLLASLGDLMPPAALAANFATRVTGGESYFLALRKCVVPAMLMLIVAIATIAWLA